MASTSSEPAPFVDTNFWIRNLRNCKGLAQMPICLTSGMREGALVAVKSICYPLRRSTRNRFTPPRGQLNGSLGDDAAMAELVDALA